MSEHTYSVILWRVPAVFVVCSYFSFLFIVTLHIEDFLLLVKCWGQLNLTDPPEGSVITSKVCAAKHR